MKSKIKHTTLLLSGLLAGGSLFAQTSDSISTKNYVQPFSKGSAFRTWSIGLHGGALSPITVFHGNDDFASPNEQWGFGGYIKKQLLPALGLQADFLKGHVQGTVPQQITPATKFRTDLNYAVSLSANITLANINWYNQKGAIQPYVTLGGGVIGYKPFLYSAAAPGGAPYRTDGKNLREAFIPVGAGFKINLGSGVNLDLGYQVNFVHADNFDGYNYGSNFDKFSYAHAGLEFSLGSRSKPQLATYNPVHSMRTEYQLKELALQNLIDAERAKNDALRNDLNTTNANLNATNANLAKLTVDTDADGVPDLFDKCPNTPSGTKVDGSGCPLPANKDVKVYITEEDKKVVKDAISNLEFDFGKATIRAKSFPSLDRVANLLISKNFSLKLAGHTDNVGSADGNMKLSKDRAESIKSYLVNKGANASRIEAVGYGKTQPIASNATEKGRQQNRRVEFTLY